MNFNCPSIPVIHHWFLMGIAVCRSRYHLKRDRKWQPTAEIHSVHCCFCPLSCFFPPCILHLLMIFCIYYLGDFIFVFSIQLWTIVCEGKLITPLVLQNSCIKPIEGWFLVRSAFCIMKPYMAKFWLSVSWIFSLGFHPKVEEVSIALVEMADFLSSLFWAHS